MHTTIGTVCFVCLASASVAGELHQAVRQLNVAVGEVVEMDVDYKIGFACDDVRILHARIETRGAHNWFVVEGVAEGSTLCRVGTSATLPSYVIEVVVEPAP